MSKLTMPERMMKLETLTENFYREFKEFRNEIKAQNAQFVTTKKHQEDVKELKTEINELKAKRWVQNTLSAILGAVLTGLIGYVLYAIFQRS